MDLLLSAFLPGRLSEIVGSGSSGGSSLLLALLARRTMAGERAALVDWADAFDPAVASAAGADLAACLWVRCGRRLAPALQAVDLLVRCPGFSLVALDLADLPPGSDRRIAPATCLRLQRAAEGSGATLVLRTTRRVAGATAQLVVAVDGRGARWQGLPRPTRLGGLLSEIRVVRSRRLAPSGAGDRWQIEWRP
jgi:hypothetical protein